LALAHLIVDKTASSDCCFDDRFGGNEEIGSAFEDLDVAKDTYIDASAVVSLMASW
jgi:hypothetical protein